MFFKKITVLLSSFVNRMAANQAERMIELYRLISGPEQLKGGGLGSAARHLSHSGRPRGACLISLVICA